MRGDCQLKVREKVFFIFMQLCLKNERSEVAQLCVRRVNLWQLISVCVCVCVCMCETRQLQYWFILCVCAGESLSSLSRGPGEQMAGRTKDEEKQFRQKIEGWDGTNSERHTQGTKESGVELRMAVVTPWRAVIYIIVVKIVTVQPTVFLLLHIIHYLWQIKDPPWAPWQGKAD